MLKPLSYIGEEIEVRFDEPPALAKRPHCPDAFVWRGETLAIRETLDSWVDYQRRGKAARNMQPGHAATAAQRGSWGVGRFFFRVAVEDGRLFELYYDRTPKSAADGLGFWFLRCQLEQAPPAGD